MAGIELLAVRYGKWIRIEFDSEQEARAAANMAIEGFPGPYAPETIFKDGQPLYEDWIYPDRPFPNEAKEKLLGFYAIAEEEIR